MRYPSNFIRLVLGNTDLAANCIGSTLGSLLTLNLIYQIHAMKALLNSYKNGFGDYENKHTRPMIHVMLKTRIELS